MQKLFLSKWEVDKLICPQGQTEVIQAGKNGSHPPATFKCQVIPSEREVSIGNDWASLWLKVRNLGPSPTKPSQSPLSENQQMPQ